MRSSCLKALEAAFKNRDLGFDAAELEQIAKGSSLGVIYGILTRMF